jgi:ribonuclease Z
MAYTQGELTYDLTITEVEGGEEFTNDGYIISVYATEHGMQSVGYVVREPDAPGKVDIEKARALGIDDSPLLARIKKGETVNGVNPADVLTDPVPGLSVSYTGDTLPTPSVVEASNGVDVLIHESTYMQSESENAKAHFHSTSIDAATVARDAGARFLLLTHVSNRYDERSKVQSEARTVFPESFVVDDMYCFEVTRRGLFLKSDGMSSKS